MLYASNQTIAPFSLFVRILLVTLIGYIRIISRNRMLDASLYDQEKPDTSVFCTRYGIPLKLRSFKGLIIRLGKKLDYLIILICMLQGIPLPPDYWNPVFQCG